MWIKSSDNKLHDAQNCIIEVVPPKTDGPDVLYIVPYGAKAIPVTCISPVAALQVIERGLGEGKLLIEV